MEAAVLALLLPPLVGVAGSGEAGAVVITLGVEVPEERLRRSGRGEQKEVTGSRPQPSGSPRTCHHMKR